MMNVEGFSTIAVDVKYFGIYDRVDFQRDTVLGTWKRRWAVLRK